MYHDIGDTVNPSRVGVFLAWAGWPTDGLAVAGGVEGELADQFAA